MRVLTPTGIVLLAFVFAAGEPERFWPAYLVATLFALTIALGALFFVLIHHLTRAGWSVVLRRQAESIAGSLPFLSLLFLPIAFNLDALYPWVDHANDAKALYLNASFFRARMLVYLLAWSLIAWWMRRLSIRQDMTGSFEISRSLRKASAPALVFFGVSVSFAAFDWLMSLEPSWFSSIFGVYFFAGSAVAYLAFQAVALGALSVRGRELPATAEHFHALGKLLFGFLCFWAYIAFSQYLLIWYANVPEETAWYAHRLRGSWGVATFALGLGHFVVPFFFFLPVRTKKSRSLLVAGASFLLLMHYADLYWLVLPATGAPSAFPHGLDLLTLAGTTMVVIGVAGRLMDRASLVPHRDPRLEESLSFENV